MTPAAPRDLPTGSPATRSPTTCSPAPDCAIAYSIVLVDPADRRPGWPSSLFGGEFPARDILRRLFVIHVLLVPARDRRPALRPPRDPLAPEAHAVPRTRAHRAQRRRLASCGRPTPLKSVGLFAVVAGVLALLGGLAQINPIWLYGPFEPAAVTHRRAARLVPGLDRGRAPPLARRVSSTSVRTASPRSSGPRSCCPASPSACSTLWPFLESGLHPRPRASTTCSTGRATARSAPRSAWACSPSTLVLARSPAARTSSPRQLDVSLSAVLWTFRVLVFVLPVALRRVHLQVLPRPRTPPARGPGRGRRRTADRAERAAVDRRLPTGTGTGTGTGIGRAGSVRPVAAHRVRGRHPVPAAPRRRPTRARATLSGADQVSPAPTTG